MIETKFNRSSWFTLAISLCLLIVVLSLNVYRFGLPTDGWVYVQDNGLTENILGLSSAIQPGDMPTSLDGLTFDGAIGTRPENWQAGHTVEYTVLQDGQSITIPVPIGKWDLAALGKNVLNNLRDNLTGLYYFAIGIFVFLRRPQNSAARVLLFLGTVRLSMSLMFIVPQTLTDSLDPFATITVALLGYYIWGLLLFPTFLLLSLIFPKPKQPFRTHPTITLAALYLLEPLMILVIGGPFVELGPFIGFGMVAVYGLLTVISVIHTLITERDDPVAQAQIRWVGFGVALVAGYQFINNMVGLLSPSFQFPTWLNLIDTLIYLTLPTAIGIAVLRYRLWDIDVIIRRTLQYTLLTGLLVLVYFGSVVLLQSVVENISGEQSPIVIVFSTLAIAALFTPLRQHVQDFIDRRFYRKKYDAEQALSRFISTARDEVDVDNLVNALVNIIDETMQPEKLSIWFKK